MGSTSYTDYQVTNKIQKEPIRVIEHFMVHGEWLSITPENQQTTIDSSDMNKTKPPKEKRIQTSKEIHSYFGKLAKGHPLDTEELKEHIVEGIKYCPSTVTTHLLYFADIKGMNRQDVFNAALPIVIASKPGFTFIQTLIRGLVRQDAWKLISTFIRDDVSSKVNQFVFELLEHNIKKRNRRCLREMPRQGRIANRIRGHLKMRPAKWRHIFAGGSKGSIVTFMSNNDWNKIEYTKISVYNLAMNYHAFMKHDKMRFKAFLSLHPETSLAMKKCRFKKNRLYLSQKEIYDNYVVPMLKEGDKKCRK